MTKTRIEAFREYLQNQEKAAATILKYMRDVEKFLDWLGENGLTKHSVLEYKDFLCQTYAPASVNAALASLNGFFVFIERHDLKVKNLKIQKNVFSSADKELTKEEYERLLQAAERKSKRLSLVLQTIASTGIRVSELSHITVQAALRGVADIRCKGKHRQIFLPKGLCKILKEYAKKQKIKSGPVFITKNGTPLDRSNIWSEMKKLCKKADIIVPNITEAVFLLGEEYREPPYSDEYINDLLIKLSALGPSMVVLTGIHTEENKISCFAYDKNRDEFYRCDSERYSGTYYGTGDIFASALLGAYMNGKDIFRSTEIALDFTCKAVKRTFEAGTDTRLGVNFEQGISDYIKILEG